MPEVSGDLRFLLAAEQVLRHRAHEEGGRVVREGWCAAGIVMTIITGPVFTAFAPRVLVTRLVLARALLS
jgi:hypothetical protein